MKLEIELDFDNIDNKTLEEKGYEAAYILIRETVEDIVFLLQEEIERRRAAMASLINFCNTGSFL